jgi:hypothetical protein
VRRQKLETGQSVDKILKGEDRRTDGGKKIDPQKRCGLSPGVDVIIPIFCDFSQLSAKKLAFFSKTNAMFPFLQKQLQ